MNKGFFLILTVVSIFSLGAIVFVLDKKIFNDFIFLYSGVSAGALFMIFGNELREMSPMVKFFNENDKSNSRKDLIFGIFYIIFIVFIYLFVNPKVV